MDALVEPITMQDQGLASQVPVSLMSLKLNTAVTPGKGPMKWLGCKNFGWQLFHTAGGSVNASRLFYSIQGCYSAQGEL